MQNPKIICFVGNQRAGKSTTMRKLLDEFFKISVFYPNRWREFILTFFHNGRKMGMHSRGDTIEILEEGLLKLKDNDCDVIVCARHPLQEFTDTIQRHFPNSEILEINCEGQNSQEEWDRDNERRFREFEEYLG
jgi:hypothetical protein